MQTFLPYPDFKLSAKCLDNKRLGKQRVECMQILNLLLGNTNTHYKNHPAVKMWNGSIFILLLYTKEICKEWKSRGFQDTVEDKIMAIWYARTVLLGGEALCELCGGQPKWLGLKEFHDSHKSNLLRKDYNWYSQFNWDVPIDLPYYWPTKELN